jgi:membrane protease YdiL (CAAX protease family)
MFPVADAIHAPGWVHLAFFGLFIPLAALRSAKNRPALQRAAANRLRHFRAQTVSLVMLPLLSILVVTVERVQLFPRTAPTAVALLAGALMYVIVVAYMRPRWRRAVEKRVEIVRLFMPANASERAWWVAVAVLAGVGEEITWRGAQVAFLGVVTGSYWIAVLLSAAMFGFGHIVQGWRSVVVIVVFAFGFQALVALAGSLYVAMAVHIAYDITAGISYGRLGRELGYSDPAPDETPQPGAA